MRRDLSQCEAIIYSVARRYVYRLSPNSLYTLQDLVSEGWIVYMRCLDRELDGGKFSSYLYGAVVNHYKAIIYRENMPKMRHTSVPIDDVDSNSLHSDSPSPERMAMIADAIVALSEVSVDFAKMISDGPPKELLAIARRSMRAKRFRKGASHKDVNISFLLTRDMIENYFNVNLEFLRELLSNYI